MPRWHLFRHPSVVRVLSKNHKNVIKLNISIILSILSLIVNLAYLKKRNQLTVYRGNTKKALSQKIPLKSLYPANYLK